MAAWNLVAGWGSPLRCAGAGKSLALWTLNKDPGAFQSMIISKSKKATAGNAF